MLMVIQFIPVMKSDVFRVFLQQDSIMWNQECGSAGVKKVKEVKI